MKEERVEKVLSEMKRRGIPQMIISDPSCIFYFTGKWFFPEERMIVLYLNVNGNHKFVVNELFPIEDDMGVEKVWYNDTQDAVKILSKYVNKEKKVGIDKNWPSHFLIELMELKAGSSFVNGSPIVDEVRGCKDEEEKNLMREASRVNDCAMQKMKDKISECLTEGKMADDLLKIYKEMGAQGFSFEPIVAYGFHASDPHHSTDAVSKVKEGDCIVIDMGCRKDSYCSDMTRTFYYRKVSDEDMDIYNTALEANKRAESIIKPGVRFCDIDKAARSYIESKGYGKYFTHRTGHSIGIDTHEFGDVSSVNTNTVKEGMIFSIEPGIYRSGKNGVRIEDLVLVTKDGCEILNKFSKELTIIK